MMQEIRLTPEERKRYTRHILLREVGGQGQQRLSASRVLIAGAGGICTPVIQYLAAAGIGSIGIVDNDVVELSNLQRQTIYGTGDIGSLKTLAAKKFIHNLNPGISVTTYPERLTGNNAVRILRSYDLVVEGVDNFRTRYALNTGAITLKIPLVSAAVSRFDGYLSTFASYRKPGILPCYRCFIPGPPPENAQTGCEREGVLGVVTGIVGSLAAMEVIRELLGMDNGLSGRLTVYEGLSGRLRTVQLKADPACPDCSPETAAADIHTTP